jgi:hypothetical protein
VTGVVAYLVLVVTLPALLLGHQGQDFPPLLWWRTLKARRAREARCAPAGALHSPSRLPDSLRGAPRASQKPSRPAPSWAHTQPLDYEEAA